MAEFRAFQWSNFARSLLTSGASASSDTLPIDPADVDLFPELSDFYEEQIFSLVVWKADLSAFEVMYCTAVNGANLSVERAQEGTTALSFTAGDIVVHTCTAAFFEQSFVAAPTAPVLSGERDGTYTEDVNLTWTAAVAADVGNDVVQYQIYRQIGAGLFTLIATVGNTVLAYTDEGAFESDSSTKNYYVVGVMQAGPNAQSNTVEIVGSMARIVAVSSTVFDTDKQVMYSDDGGLTWTSAVQPVAGNIQGVCYSADDQLFVAVGQNGECWTSPDGITWTDQSSNTPDATTDWNRVEYASSLGLYVAVAQSGSQRAMYTTDPTSVAWTLTDAPDNAEQWVGLLWSTTYSRLFAGCTFDAEPIGFSDNGTSWANATTLVNGLAGYDIVEGASGRIVASNRGGTDDVYTDDGSLWAVNAAGIGSGCLSLAYGNGTWVRSHSNRVWTSTTGLSWTDRGDPGSTVSIESLLYSEEFGLFIGLCTSDECYTSPDGITWTQRILPTGANGAAWQGLVEGSVAA